MNLNIKKYFYTNDDFSKLIIYVNIIALCMHYCHMKKFQGFSIFLVYKNWFLLLKKVEEKFLTPNKVAKLRQRLDEKVAK